MALKYDLFVVSDEAYRCILFDGASYTSIASLPGMKERTLIVDSCSKTFAMTGYRVGFGAGSKYLIDLMTKLTEGVYSCAASVSVVFCGFKQLTSHTASNTLIENEQRSNSASCLKGKKRRLCRSFNNHRSPPAPARPLCCAAQTFWKRPPAAPSPSEGSPWRPNTTQSSRSISCAS